MSQGPQGKAPKYCYARRGSPFWWYQFTLNGQRYRGSTGYEGAEDAEEFVRTLRARIRNDAKPEKNAPVVAAITGELYKPETNEIMWSEALDRVHDDQIAGTADERNALRRAVMLLDRIGDIPLHEINHAILFRYRTERAKDLNRLGDPISPLTVNRDLMHCRQVFNHIIDLGKRLPSKPPQWGKLIDNEAEQNAARTRYLSTDEEERLFEAADEVAPHLTDMIEFLLLCGQRKAAVINLCHDDIDWQDMSFKVLLKGKGQKKREHTVPLTTRMAEIVRAQPRLKDTDRVFSYICKRTRYKPEGGYLRKRGGRYAYTLSGWNKDWQRILRKAGIDDFRVHDLRHTNATRVVRATGNMRAAQQVLGHRQMQTTARYAHANLEDSRAALEAIEAMGRTNRETLREERDGKVVPLRAV